MVPFGDKLTGRWYGGPYICGEVYEAEGRSPHFLKGDELDGGAFHVYPSRETAELALKKANCNNIIVKVKVNDYVCSGINGQYPTACYRQMVILG